jgi:hypothetical protein
MAVAALAFEIYEVVHYEDCAAHIHAVKETLNHRLVMMVCYS